MRFDLLLDLGPGLLDGSADQPGVKIIAGRDQCCGRQSERHLDDPVLDKSVLGNQHDKRTSGSEMDEFDMLQRSVLLRGYDHPGAMRQTRKRANRLVERLRQALAASNTKAFDAAALVFGEATDFEQTVDKQPQPRFSRQPTGRGVRRIEQPRFFEIGHDVADRRR